MHICGGFWEKLQLPGNVNINPPSVWEKTFISTALLFWNRPRGVVSWIAEPLRSSFYFSIPPAQQAGEISLMEFVFILLFACFKDELHRVWQFYFLGRFKEILSLHFSCQKQCSDAVRHPKMYSILKTCHALERCKMFRVQILLGSLPVRVE